MKLALRIYRWLASAFPHEFKLVYGRDLLQLGEDVVEEIAKQHGVAGMIRLVVDIAIRVPAEYLSEMRRDILYALRALIKSPGFALVGIISLGLGMGVTTSVFTKLWTQFFRGLPAVTNSAELVMPQNPLSYYYIEQYRDAKSLFDGVAAFQNGVPFNVASATQAQNRSACSGNLFRPSISRCLESNRSVGGCLAQRLTSLVARRWL
jgi:putative ABC transport system permease protein